MTEYEYGVRGTYVLGGSITSWIESGTLDSAEVDLVIYQSNESDDRHFGLVEEDWVDWKIVRRTAPVEAGPWEDFDA